VDGSRQKWVCHSPTQDFAERGRVSARDVDLNDLTVPKLDLVTPQGQPFLQL
jgi:hypothetical protein